MAYYPHEMPDIVKIRDEIAKEGQTFKVTYSDGSFEYLNETTLKERGLNA